MTTALYAPTKLALLQGGINLGTVGVWLVPVNAQYTPNFTTHDFLDDVPAPARAATALQLASVTLSVTNGKAILDAADVTFAGVAAGDPIIGFVAYLTGASDAARKLLGYFDYFSNVPITPDGRDIIVTWPNSEDRIFSF